MSDIKVAKTSPEKILSIVGLGYVILYTNFAGKSQKGHNVIYPLEANKSRRNEIS